MGGISQTRQRLGEEPAEETFAQVAARVATLDSRRGLGVRGGAVVVSLT
jgi:hypothetical protein